MEICIEMVQDRKSHYIEEGKLYLDVAQKYLHEHCEEWNSEHEYEYCSLIRTAEHYMIKVEELENILKGVYS